MPSIDKKEGFSPALADKKPPNYSDKGVKSGIMGICLALVIVSIAYSTYIVGYGTSWSTSTIIMLIPQAVFAALALLYACYKTFK